MKSSASSTSAHTDIPQLLTLDEAAKRLAVCRRTLEREIAHGRFPRPVKIGSATRVEALAVVRYLDGLREQALKA